MMRTVLVAIAALACVLPGEANGQSKLDAVEELAAQGRADEARADLVEWWEDDRGQASRNDLQRGLWLRGRLTVDPTQAVRDFRRLVVEYPGGPYTDAALFRLAQASHATGDVEGARRYLASLSRDYPNSAVRRRAEAWLVGAGAPPTPARRGEAGSEDASSGAGSGNARVEPETTVGVETTPPPPPPSATRTDPPRTEGRYSVQLGAFSGADRAEALRERAEDAGLEPRIVNVRGSRLLHVRVGRFDSSREASVFFRNVTDLGFTAAVVRDADREESRQ